MLFGPREAGCWEFLLLQAWGFCLIAGAIGWFSGNPVAWKVARGFFAEAFLLTLFLVSVAQSFWVEERFPQIPDRCSELVGYLFVGSLLSLFVGPILQAPVLSVIAGGGFAFLFAQLLFSVVLRLCLFAWGRLHKGPPEP